MSYLNPSNNKAIDSLAITGLHAQIKGEHIADLLDLSVSTKLMGL